MLDCSLSIGMLSPVCAPSDFSYPIAAKGIRTRSSPKRSPFRFPLLAVMVECGWECRLRGAHGAEGRVQFSVETCKQSRCQSRPHLCCIYTFQGRLPFLLSCNHQSRDFVRFAHFFFSVWDHISLHTSATLSIMSHSKLCLIVRYPACDVLVNLDLIGSFCVAVEIQSQKIYCSLRRGRYRPD